MTREPYEFRELLERGLPGRVPAGLRVLDGDHAGCATLARDVAAAGKIFTPHTWGNGIGLMANLHLTAGTVGAPFIEFPFDPPEWTTQRRDYMLTPDHRARRRRLDHALRRAGPWHRTGRGDAGADEERAGDVLVAEAQAGAETVSEGDARPIEVHWFLPTTGDGRSVVDFFPDPSGKLPSSARTADIGYLRQIAQAADRLGFEGVLTPTGAGCEDAWLIAAALAADTAHLRFIVAFRPGFILPTLAAQQTATLQRITGGRALINIVVGGDAAEQRGYGDFLEHDERYDRADEFVTIARKCWDSAPFNFEGKHYRIEKGGLGRTFAAVDAAADLLRRRIAGGGSGCGAPRRRVPAVGRASGVGSGARDADAVAGGGAGAHAALRHSHARHRAREARPTRGRRRSGCCAT